MSTAMDDLWARSLQTRGGGAPTAEAGSGGTPPIGGESFDSESNAGGEARDGESEAAENTSDNSRENRILLTQCEGKIREFGKAAADAGEAFQTIKDQRLHLINGQTWEEYTLTWGVSASQVDRLIAAAPLMRALGIANEGTARPLVPAWRTWGQESARALWDGTKAGSGDKPTAKLLRAAVQSVRKGSKKPTGLAPAKMQEMARKAVARAIKEEEKGQRAPKGKSSSEWRMPEEDIKRWSALFVERARLTASEPESVMRVAYQVLSKRYAEMAEEEEKEE